MSAAAQAAPAAPETPDTTTAAGTRPVVDEVREAMGQMFGAERRLRGREHAPGELTHAHIRSLHALSARGEMTAGELARSADLNPASVTAMLDHLEAMEIVVRTRSTTDRRVCNVSLTPKGAKLIQEKSARWQAMWSDRLQGFDDAELDAAARVVRELAGMLDGVATAKEREAAART